MIPYGKQNITDDDIAAVVEALKSDFLTQGPRISAFEESFANYVGAKYAVAVANGTAALHLSTLALGVKQGDKVITTPITFAASANCVRYCGGDVVFSDIDPDTYLIDIDKVAQLVNEAPPGTFSGIIPVDFAGRAVNLETLRNLADEHGLWIIEDACHAPGGYFVDTNGRKQHCGNGKLAHLSVFSFHPVKHIAAGEGGMITTDDEVVYKTLLTLRTHGITREREAFLNQPDLASGFSRDTDYPGWYMEMQALGFNYRLTDFQAALGLSQMKRADAGLARRKEIAAKYNDAFTNKPFIKGHSGNYSGHAYHLYVIEVEQRRALYEYLRQRGIFAQIHYFPCHLMPYYQVFGWKKGDFPAAETYYERCLSLPMYPTLSHQEQDYVIETIHSFYNVAV